MNTKTKEALRIIGHLLETNGTIGALAKARPEVEVNYYDKRACKFCLAGATYLVGDRIYGLGQYSSKLSLEVKSYLKTGNLVAAWDDATDNGRKKIIQKLKNA